MILYKLVKTYVKFGLFLFYKKIKVSGKENIPNTGPILFVANHQNAMMDPLVVSSTTSKTLYFLARASAFKNKIAGKLLNTIHAIAIYRQRDGVNYKKLNKAVFEHCLSLFNEDQNILIFPEGSHDIKRQVRSLRAGFTQMSIDYLRANPKKELLIVPIGLNYSNTLNYAESVHVIFGKPISSRAFFDTDNDTKTKNNLRAEVYQQLRNITVHIDDENYDEVFKSLSDKDYLYPEVTNLKIKNNQLKVKFKKTKNKNIFYYLMLLNSVFPFLIWNWLKPKIEAVEFISTAKFSLGLTVFHLFYILQTVLVFSMFGAMYALIYIAICFILVFLSTKTR